MSNQYMIFVQLNGPKEDKPKKKGLRDTKRSNEIKGNKSALWINISKIKGVLLKLGKFSLKH